MAVPDALAIAQDLETAGMGREREAVRRREEAMTESKGRHEETMAALRAPIGRAAPGAGTGGDDPA